VSGNDTFEIASEHHRAGRLAEAEKYYLLALPTHVSRAYVLALLASVVQGLGRVDEAIDLQRQSLNERPDVAEAWVNLGTMLLAAGRYEESVAVQQRAIAMRPELVEAWINLSATFRLWGKPADAAGVARRAIALRPGLAESHYQLGSALRQLGQMLGAIESFEKAVELNDRLFEAWYELGCTLLEVSRVESAEQSLSRAQSLRPDSAEAACALGGAMCLLGRWEPARALYEKSLRLRPDLLDAQVGLATVLRGQGEARKAADAYSLCIKSPSSGIEAQRGLAFSLFDQGRFDEAIEVFERLARAHPDKPEVQYALGQELLLRGDFRRGWPLFEQRLRVPRLAPLVPGPFPAWDGSDLKGRHILLHQEQGLGDTIQFVRYVKMPAFRNARVVLRCQRLLRTLFEGQFEVEAVVADGEALPPDIDCHCTLPSLPAKFKTDESTVLATVPYLRPAPELVDAWRTKIGERCDALRVGLVWAGNPAHPRDRRRSMDPTPLFRMAAEFGSKVRWFSLQKLAGGAGVDPREAGLKLMDFTVDLADFAQTAALISQLDLVLTVDTSVAHLAGAMGIPVWVMLPFMPDWRWQLGRSDSPWYPVMRLFRQQGPDVWDSVLRDVSGALRDRLT
jgi:tetratricopeptide (TPR) repeat protein